VKEEWGSRHARVKGVPSGYAGSASSAGFQAGLRDASSTAVVPISAQQLMQDWSQMMTQIQFQKQYEQQRTVSRSEHERLLQRVEFLEQVVRLAMARTEFEISLSELGRRMGVDDPGMPGAPSA
jgi:hypothetical protein